MRRFFITLLFALAAFPACSANLNVSVTVQSAPSTAVSCTGLATDGTFTFIGPAAAGASICTVVVAPSTWAGNIALSGADAASFGLSVVGGQTQLIVGSAGLPIRATPYAVSISATP